MVDPRDRDEVGYLHNDLGDSKETGIVMSHRVD